MDEILLSISDKISDFFDNVCNNKYMSYIMCNDYETYEDEYIISYYDIYYRNSYIDI